MLIHIHVIATFVNPYTADAAVEPSGMSLWRVTGETVTILLNAPDDKIIWLWINIFLAERTFRGIVKIGIVATVAVGGMAALSHLTHRDMGNATMMSGTSSAM